MALRRFHQPWSVPSTPANERHGSRTEKMQTRPSAIPSCSAMARAIASFDRPLACVCAEARKS